ncbi:MAG: hypothetical protein R3F14_16280 [Polyangiaceae bacterium]
MKGCLFERVADGALRAYRGVLDVEGTAMRDIVSGAKRPGYAIDASGVSSDKAAVTLRGSVIERAWALAVNGYSADMTIERVAMRTTAPQIPGTAIPRGGVFSDSGALSMSQVTIEGLYIGIIVSYSGGDIRHVTITDGAPLPPQYPLFKAGIFVQGNPPPKPPATAVVVESKIAGQPQFGAAAIDGTLSFTSCLLRGTGTEKGHDAALNVQPGVLVVKSTAVLDTFHTGVLVVGGQASIESSLVRHVEPTADSGGCLTVRPAASGSGTASLTLVSSLIEGCTETGLASIESDVALSTSVFRDIKPRPADGKFGDGIALLSKTPDRPPAKIDGCLVENAARAGISAFGRKVDLGWSAVSCAAFSLAGEAYEGVEFGYEKTGDNACGCPAADGLCKIDSPGLAPPPEH